MPYYIMYLPTASYLYTYSQRELFEPSKQQNKTVYMTEDYINTLIQNTKLGYKKFNFSIVSSNSYGDIVNKFKMLETYLKDAKNSSIAFQVKFNPGVFTDVDSADQFGKQVIEHFDIVWRDDEI